MFSTIFRNASYGLKSHMFARSFKSVFTSQSINKFRSFNRFVLPVSSTLAYLYLNRNSKICCADSTT